MFDGKHHSLGSYHGTYVRMTGDSPKFGNLFTFSFTVRFPHKQLPKVKKTHLHLSSCLLPEVLLAQFSLYVHKGGLKPDSFHFLLPADCLDITYMCYEFRTPLLPCQLKQPRRSDLGVTSTQQSVNQ